MGVYTVQADDTLYAIAQSLLSDGDRWQDIMNYTGSTSSLVYASSPDPDNLQAGQLLFVPDDNTVVVYEDANFQGKRAILTPGPHDWGQLGIANDSLSSLRTGEWVEAILYENTHFQGNYRIFETDTTYVGDDFNDITSSIMVQVTGPIIPP